MRECRCSASTRPGAGHASHSPALIRGGQAYLAQLAEETGGEAYFNANELEPSPSFDPYLADMARHFAHQYRASRFQPRRFAGHPFQRVASYAAAERGRDLGAQLLSDANVRL